MEGDRVAASYTSAGTKKFLTPLSPLNLLGSVDVLVTGNKDFGGLGLETPAVVTTAQYVEAYL